MTRLSIPVSSHMSISLSSSLLLPNLILSSLNLTPIGHPQGALTPTKSERGLQMQQKRRRILSINIFEPRKETLLMTYDSISRQPTPLPVPQSDQVLACLNRSEEHTSELQSPDHLVCLLL